MHAANFQNPDTIILFGYGSVECLIVEKEQQNVTEYCSMSPNKTSSLFGGRSLFFLI